MRIITPTYEIWNQEEGLEGIFKQIERAGRICYASDPIEGKAKEFANRMIKSGHGAILEHGTVYLKAKTAIHGGMGSETVECPLYKYSNNPYSVVKEDNEGFPDYLYVTTNLRVLVENDWLDDLQYICEPTEYHEKRITVKFSTQIAISREYNRHRVNSIAEQSTRYCNYGKDKFGNEITINLPEFINYDENSLCNQDLYTYCNIIANKKNEYPYTKLNIIDYWLFANLACEFSYLNMLKLGAKPQEARVVLPLDTNTELIHTAFISDWKNFFELRAIGTTGAPHPDAKALAEPLMNEFKQLKLI